MERFAGAWFVLEQGLSFQINTVLMVFLAFRKANAKVFKVFFLTLQCARLHFATVFDFKSLISQFCFLCFIF